MMDQGEAYLWKQRAQVAVDRIAYLEQLLSRAYPMMANPYPPQAEPRLSVVYSNILREVETVVVRAPDAGADDEDKPVTLPCASCDGDGCPNCEAPMVLSE
jgi:hypothetical protein